jgi:hypothetical protein
VFGGWRGVIEGFYGPPWSWDQRLATMAWCHQRDMTHYVYAPKDDPLHRQRWRDPYPDEDLAGFERLVAAGTLRVGFGISPGLSMDDAAATDRAALAAKVDQVLDTGVHDVVLALDDIPPAPGQGRRHGALAAWLAEHLAGRAGLVLVPTDYTSTRPTPYLVELLATCPEHVPIAWTGPTVVCDTISVADAEGRAAALGGRPPLVWDNYPVNDTVMADRLFLAPLRGRDPTLADVTDGWLCNPMVQPGASLLPLASAAAFLAGGDPETAWSEAVDALGVRPLAEACDGVRPLVLVESLSVAAPPSEDGGTGPVTEDWVDALAELRSWLEEVRAFCAAPPAEPEWVTTEAAPWVAQSATEAEVCLQAVRTLEAWGGVGKRGGAASDPAAAAEGALLLAVLWQSARRGTSSAFGARCSVRPVLSQDDDARWRFHRASLVDGANATDRLVEYALDRISHRA